jgi:hypothetical protein
MDLAAVAGAAFNGFYPDFFSVLSIMLVYVPLHLLLRCIFPAVDWLAFKFSSANFFNENQQEVLLIFYTRP